MAETSFRMEDPCAQETRTQKGGYQKKAKTPRPCCVCERTFFATQDRSRFCSNACRGKHYSNSLEFDKVCKFCEKQFSTTYRYQVYCGKECKSAGLAKALTKDRPSFNCKACGLAFEKRKRGSNDKNLYCSAKCSNRGRPRLPLGVSEARQKERERQKRQLLAEARPKTFCKTCNQTNPPHRRVFCCAQCSRQFVRPKKESVRQSAVSKSCLRCGSVFSGMARRKFCSLRCNKAQHRGECRSHRHRARKFGVQMEPVNRIKVFERDGWRCMICGDKTPKRLNGTTHDKAPELDHRVPLSKGGGHTYANTQCACRKCNSVKGDKLIVGQMPLFATPL